MTHDAKIRSRASFDRQAPLYDSTRFGQHARWLAPDVLTEIERQRPDSLLDVGCGTGALLESVLAQRPGTRLTGVDLSSQMVALARERLGERADIRVADAETLPLLSDRFDIVVCVDSFHHFPHSDAALGEIGRVLRPAGELVLAEWRVPAPLRGL